jgi:hypothetical protein
MSRGWGVRRGVDGNLEPYQHGWVDDDGRIHHETPETECLKYFAGLRIESPDYYHARAITIPFFRTLTEQSLEDGSPNPNYDPSCASKYAAARVAAQRWIAKGGGE